MNAFINTYTSDICYALSNLVATNRSDEASNPDCALELWVDATKSVKDKRGTVIFIGNGASASMAEHMSHDCFQNADLLTMTCSETAHITAIANDISYEDVFSYRIGKAATSKDMLVAISSSGNSPNVVKAIKAARDIGLFIVTVTGKSADNKARALGDLNFYVPLDTYGMVESAHAVLLHCWLDMFLDKYMGGRH